MQLNESVEMGRGIMGWVGEIEVCAICFCSWGREAVFGEAEETMKWMEDKIRVVC